MASSSEQPKQPTPFPHGVFLPNGHQTDPALPPDHPTIGYKLNHFMLRIRDPAKSIPFYVDLMGMRTVFTMNVGPFTIYYLGYPQTDEHRADLPKFGADTAGNLQHTLGLLELYHVHGSEKQEAGYYSTGNEPGHLGFGHLGFTVPDVPKALQRLKDAGVEVVKDLGVCTRQWIPITDWENERGVGVEVKGTDSEIHPEYAKVFNKIAFVKDPDGYLVELVPQNMDPKNP
ncbi:lactoylglutathione lyase [Cladophialophora yegresii CBS 114405]|uniref:Lactoylglutathione lyase n=1 Tax=Cladophialophora yegresii CBS 114405 TaxID=1182544 RepID=W9WFZ8_9EURO|nr:lactoylglutathione lyase [Cladophialophora yegresii CBS 114405]EXJ57449.1 lactoylglutathione lyase [Cladophialophora yegresii CBS 114405]